jgi:hypothetical protein
VRVPSDVLFRLKLEVDGRGACRPGLCIDGEIVLIPANRRLSKDYERLVQTSETFIEVAIICLILRRLARGREPCQTGSYVALQRYCEQPTL